jgi:hypothetical protein
MWLLDKAYKVEIAQLMSWKEKEEAKSKPIIEAKKCFKWVTKKADFALEKMNHGFMMVLLPL